MKQIPLTQGKVALVDDEDFERISGQKWWFHGGYAVCAKWVGTKCEQTSMHREILDAKERVKVFHINGDKLDNRRSNLFVR